MEAVQGWSAGEKELLASLRWSDKLRSEPTNRFADEPAAALLGSELFHDPGLGQGVSCATCHDPKRHFTDGRVRSQGVGQTKRHAPSVAGSQSGSWFTWDGRADSLWSQAAGPLEDPHEMAGDRVAAVRHAVTTYPELWSNAFGTTPVMAGWPQHAAPVEPFQSAWDEMGEQQTAVNAAYSQLLKAIGSYERTLLPRPSRFDRYVDAVTANKPTDGLFTESERRGLELFIGTANCVSCHLGPMFTDRAFHNLGLPEADVGYDQGRTVGAMQVAANPFNCRGPHSDAERCPELEYLNPTFDDFISAFKTPSLRDVTRTAPYMHNGSLPDLDAVLSFYDQLPGRPVAGHRELTLQPLGLVPADKQALIDFLGTLEGGPLPDDIVFPAR